MRSNADHIFQACRKNWLEVDGGFRWKFAGVHFPPFARPPTLCLVHYPGNIRRSMRFWKSGRRREWSERPSSREQIDKLGQSGTNVPLIVANSVFFAPPCALNLPPWEYNLSSELMITIITYFRLGLIKIASWSATIERRTL